MTGIAICHKDLQSFEYIITASPQIMRPEYFFITSVIMIFNYVTAQLLHLILITLQIVTHRKYFFFVGIYKTYRLKICFSISFLDFI